MLKCFAAHAMPLSLVLALGAPALAGNEPENGARRTEEDVLPRVVAAWGVPLSFTVDGESLRKSNKDIGTTRPTERTSATSRSATSGNACKSAVRAAHIAKVACKGLPGNVGSLTLTSGGALTVGRAYQETKPYLRSRKQFESLVKVTLGLASDDPYQDEASYTHKYPGGSAELTTKEDGRVRRLQCVPAAKDDPKVRKPCGFDGPATTSIYDGTGKVSRVLTFKDGALQKEGAGTSDSVARSEVSFKDGKKQGDERVLRRRKAGLDDQLGQGRQGGEGALVRGRREEGRQGDPLEGGRDGAAPRVVPERKSEARGELPGPRDFVTVCPWSTGASG
jgi:hypothetical protein